MTIDKDIRVLIDERATKEAIMHRLEWLVKGAKAGDRLLLHFSGHGSQIRDRNGDELKDQLDEILCPHDMDGQYGAIKCTHTFNRNRVRNSSDIVLECIPKE